MDPISRSPVPWLLRVPSRVLGTPPRGGPLAETVEMASVRVLEELLRTPARRLILAGVFWDLSRRLNGRRLQAAPASVRFFVIMPAETDVYELHFSDERCRILRGQSDRTPELSITLTDGELVRLLSGRSTPLQALFGGRLKVRGNIGALAALLLTFGD